MDEYKNHQDQEEAEETLSLVDLPLTADEHSGENLLNISDRESSAEPTSVFEFFSDPVSEIYHAEDIIFGGKLKPFNKLSLSNQTHKPISNKDEKVQSFHRRRCESMSELKTHRSNSTKTLLMRNSRSLDHKKLYRISESNSPKSLNNSNSSVKSDVSAQRLSKPRWYVLMFGLGKFSPEMHIGDIRNRQVRRNPAVLFPSSDAGGKDPVNRKSSWGLLGVLSCKCHASVAVTASFGFMPHTSETAFTRASARDSPQDFSFWTQLPTKDSNCKVGQ